MEASSARGGLWPFDPASSVFCVGVKVSVLSPLPDGALIGPDVAPPADRQARRDALFQEALTETRVRAVRPDAGPSKQIQKLSQTGTPGIPEPKGPHE